MRERLKRRSILRALGVPAVAAILAVAACTSAQQQDGAGSGQQGSAPERTGPAVESPPEGGWNVLADGSSMAGYRVGEKIAWVPTPGDAVGKTTALTGGLTVTRNTVTTISVTADLTKLKSDQDRRDRALKTRGLETERFPTAVFETAGPISFDPIPPAGQSIDRTVMGSLTLHGEKRDVELPLSAKWEATGGGGIRVTGKLEIKMADYGIDPPSTAGVVTVEDHGKMEFDVVFVPGTR